MNASSRKGQYALLLGLGLVPLIGVGALSLDLSIAATLQSQADAAAYAAAQSAIVAYNEDRTVGEAKVFASNVVDTYTPLDGHKFVLEGIDWGYVDPKTGQLVASPDITAARARVRRVGDIGVATMFGRLFGLQSINVAGSAVSEQLPSNFAHYCDFELPFLGSPGHIARGNFDKKINVPVGTVPTSGWYAVYKDEVAESGPSQRNESSFYRVFNDATLDGLPRETNCGDEYIVRDYDNNLDKVPDRVLLGEFYFDADSPNTIQMRHYCSIVTECPQFEDPKKACGSSSESIHFNRGDANLCLQAR